MEGRYPNGLLLAMTNCTDSAKLDEYNYWYNYMHVPDVTRLGVWIHGMRFVDSNPKPGDHRYIATFETDRHDIDTAWAERVADGGVLKEMGRSGTHFYDLVLAGPFKRLGGEYRAANRPVRGILIVLMNCNDPAREDEFNQWYSDVHIPDILDTGLWHTAYRYEMVAPEAHLGTAARAKFLAIFETDHSDPAKAAQETMKSGADRIQRGRVFEGRQIVHSIPARRVWPMD